MDFLRHLKLSKKIPILITLLCIVTGLAVGLISYVQFRTSILKSQEETFSTALEGQVHLLANWFTDVESQVSSLAINPYVSSAISRLSAGWSELPTDPQALLQRIYIHENPNPTGEKHRLVKAKDSTLYSSVHAEVHPYFVKLLEQYGYYDIFLFDVSGNLIYSTYKEGDYATNFLRGQFSSSGLGSVFVEAMASVEGEVVFSDYDNYAPSNGAPAAFLASPVYSRSGSAIGAVAIQLSSDKVEDLIQNGNNLGVDRTFLVGPDNKLRSSLNESLGLPVLSPYTGSFAGLIVENRASNSVLEAVGLTGQPVMTARHDVSLLGAKWTVIAETDYMKILAPLKSMQSSILVAGGTVCFVVLALGILTARQITMPIASLQRNLSYLIERRYELDFEMKSRFDEFGDISQSVVALKDSLQKSEETDYEFRQRSAEQSEVVESLTKALSRLADGDLTRKILEPFSEALEPVRENYNLTLNNLNELVGEVLESSMLISTEATDISANADNLSQRTENQAATLEQTAAALDELTSGVRQAAQSAKQAETIVSETKASALEGQTIVDDSIAAMLNIEESSNRIAEIIGVIDEIAFQTNLLALNAGVEAGRAGDAGRGFAVVASEVGSLAQRSSDAAKEIKKLIAGSARQVAKGVEDVTGAGEAISSIVDRVTHISDLMREIASAAVEQSHSLDEINIGVNQLDQVTQQNAAMVVQSTDASHQLTQKTEKLGMIVSQFNTAQQNEPDADDDWVVRNDRERISETFVSSRSAELKMSGANNTDSMWQSF